MRSNRGVEQELVERITDERVREAFNASLDSNRQIDQHWLDAARAIILWGGIGGSLLCFHTAALSWRTYELASPALEPSTKSD